MTRSPLSGPLASSALALAIRGCTVLALVEIAGPGLPHAFANGRPPWIALVAAAALMTYPAYALAYLSVGQVSDGVRPPLAALARIVLAGFGPVAVAGGFAADARAWRSRTTDARRRVNTMAALEWAILAPATWSVTIASLLASPSVSRTLLWPWAIGVPAGGAIAFWITSRDVRGRFTGTSHRRLAQLIGSVVTGINSVRTMAANPRRFAGAWTGMSLYWAAEVGAFDGALHTAGVRLDLSQTLLAYATGYLASRRSLPLGGAGLTEAMLVYSLHELSVSVGPAVFAVLVYRMFNFVLVVAPALAAWRAT